ncbi:MAG TPA: hypothetical protein VH593_24115, partial [Ktedonobacteraceae bacterium]
QNTLFSRESQGQGNMSHPEFCFEDKRPISVGAIIHSAPLQPIHPDGREEGTSDQSGRYE